jgi:hypothetical protein
MEIAYLICAVLGGTLLVCQFVMTLMGLGGDDAGGDDAGGDHDVHHDTTHDHHGTNWFVGVLTFRTIVAALTFFGLAGLAAHSKGLEPELTFAVALAAGAGAMFFVGWLMQQLHRLNADGSVHIERAVGQAGTVYLKVPGRKGGAGKVHLTVQNRTVECQAITAHEDLPTGARIVVVAVLNADTVEVAPVSTPEKVTTHV